ncbi:MAG: molybdenum cofactor guanylyltransferase [Acidimicrobiales bacterium]
MRVVGAVLVGGVSRRMGQDKAMLLLDGRPMAARVADALRAAGADPVVLVGGDRAWAGELGLDRVADRWPREGPLAGLASALNPTSDEMAYLTHPVGGSGTPEPGAEVIVLVSACDQPDLDVATLSALVDKLVAAPAEVLAAAVTTADGRRHPFPSAWRLAAGPILVELVDEGARRAEAGLDTVPVIDVVVDLASLDDLDTPDDVRRWTAARPSL